MSISVIPIIYNNIGVIFVNYVKIRDLREDNDYKQTQIADYLNIAQGTYSDYERGEINIPVEALIKLAAFYDTSVDYLLGLTDYKNPYPRKKSKR